MCLAFVVACLSLAYCAQAAHESHPSKSLCTAFGLCKLRIGTTLMRRNKLACQSKASGSVIVSPSTPLHHHLDQTINNHLEILGDFASVITQSAIIASASTPLVQNIPNLQLVSRPHFVEIQTATAARLPRYSEVTTSSADVKLFKLNCIRDGFEYAHSGHESQGDSISYRQCEVLRVAAAGYL